MTEYVEMESQRYDSNKLTKKVGFRLPEATADSWTDAAKAQKLSLSDWLRAQITLGEKVAEQTKIRRRGQPEIFKLYQLVDPVLVSEIAKIGNNLNQLTRQINTAVATGRSIDAVEFLAIFQLIASDLSDIRLYYTASHTGVSHAH